MSLIPISRRHMFLISRHAAANAVRTGSGLMFLLMGLVYGLSVAAFLLWSVEMTQMSAGRHGPATTTNEAVSLMKEQIKPLVVWSLGGKISVAPPGSPPKQKSEAEIAQTEKLDRWAGYLLNDRPELLSGLFILLLIGVPLLVPVVAFNQLSGDVQSKGLRYLLLRTERANIFLGRFVGTALFAVVVIAIIIATVTLYVALKVRIYEVTPLAKWAAFGFVALSLLVLPYIALCSWFSASINSPFLSLITASLTIGGVPLAAVIAKARWEPAGNLRYLLPWGWQNHLLHFEWSNVALAAAGCVGYTLVFLAIGYWRFERRDL